MLSGGWDLLCYIRRNSFFRWLSVQPECRRRRSRLLTRVLEAPQKLAVVDYQAIQLMAFQEVTGLAHLSHSANRIFGIPSRAFEVAATNTQTG